MSKHRIASINSGNFKYGDHPEKYFQGTGVRLMCKENEMTAEDWERIKTQVASPTMLTVNNFNPDGLYPQFILLQFDDCSVKTLLRIIKKGE